jgi:hypothetical protein
MAVSQGRHRGQKPSAEMRAIAATDRPAVLARGMRWNPRNPIMARVTIDGSELEAQDGERLIDAVNRAGLQLSQVCYHPPVGPDSDLRYLSRRSRRQSIRRNPFVQSAISCC